MEYSKRNSTLQEDYIRHFPLLHNKTGSLMYERLGMLSQRGSK